MDLKQALIWAQTVGAGILAYVIMERWPWACGLAPQHRRWLAFVLAGAIGLAAWGVGLVFRYVPIPAGDWRPWVEAAFSVAAGAILAAQALHGAIKLPAKA